MNLDGLVLIDKPQSWTSFDVVNKIRNICPRGTKVGHAGTLDPLATGLLILLVGRATKKQQNLMKLDKTYLVEAVLGSVSDSFDADGQITHITDNLPTKEVITESLLSFIGVNNQTPPIFSAIKVNGKRAYDLARAGKQVEMKSREVTIYSIDTISFDGKVLKFQTAVSSGTYIRSLVHDLGEKLGCGAYIGALRRSTIGEFNIENSLPQTDWKIENIQQQIDSNPII